MATDPEAAVPAGTLFLQRSEACRPPTGGLRLTRSQVGSGPPVASDSQAAGRRGSATMTRTGETGAGSAGMQPCRGIARWKLIEADVRGTVLIAALPSFIGFDRFPHALKIPAPKWRNSGHRETATLHFTLNQDITGACHTSRDASDAAVIAFTAARVAVERNRSSSCDPL